MVLFVSESDARRQAALGSLNDHLPIKHLTFAYVYVVILMLKRRNISLSAVYYRLL